MKKIRLFSLLAKLALIAGLSATSAWGQEYLLYTMGYNADGELGTGDNNDRNNPTGILIPGGKTITQVAGGRDHSLVVTTDGELYAMGDNQYGQLGTGDHDPRNKPTLIEVGEGKTVAQVVAGDYHSLVMTTEGELYTMGSNDYGQLGTGDNTERNTPTLIIIPEGKTVAQIVTGGYRSFVVTTDGTLYTMGIFFHEILAHDFDPTARNTPTLLTLPDSKNVAQVAASQAHGLMITTDGMLYVMGWNEYGQLGTGDYSLKETPTFIDVGGSKSVARVAVGYYHSLVITTDGDLYAMGDNYYGQLGNGEDGSGPRKNTPMLITIPGGKSVAQVAAGAVHSLVVTTDSELYTMGNNEFGQLGTWDLINRNRPTLIPTRASEILTQIAGGTRHSAFIVRVPIDATKGYNLFANTESYQYYPLNEIRTLREPITYEVIGQLPEGLKIRDGVLQGVTPNVGTYSFSIVLTSEIDQIVIHFTLKVMPPSMQPIITGVYLNGVFSTTTIVEGSTHTTPAVTELYNATVPVDAPLTMAFVWDFIKAPVCYCLVGGDFPDGLTFNGNTGEITGTPTQTGEYIFVVSVMDWRGRAFQWVRLVVE